MAGFVLTAITNDPELAARADRAGVDRIGVDIERLNKSARQKHLRDARISDHEISDLDLLASKVRHAALFVRLNPLHPGSREEVEEAIGRGATVLMLPFFTTAQEVDRFVGLVDGRAQTVALLETAPAVVRLHEILAVPGIVEIIVGLNDLRLSMGVSNNFELVASDLMTMISDRIRAAGLRFGFGGLARADDSSLPVPADLVLAQNARLGSSTSWLSRSFYKGCPALDIGAEVVRLRQRLAFWATQPEEVLLFQRDALRHHLNSLTQHSNSNPTTTRNSNFKRR